MQEFIKKEPELKFQKGKSILKSFRLNEVVDFYKGKNISKKDINKDGKYPCIRYGELYTVYNELINKVISKTDLSKSSLVFSKRKDIIIPSSGETNLDIATASCILKEGIALGGDLNILRPKPSSDFSSIYLAYYLNNKKKKRIAALAQGNSVVHLYKHHLSGLKLMLPDYKEQQKIASFLSTVDKKINLLETKIEHLEQYKKGVVQKIFKQEIRFKQDDGNDFPEWEKKKLGDFLNEHKLKSTGNEEVFSVSVHKGLINQVEHLGRSFAAKNTSKYNLVKPGDIVYTKSPTGDFPWGIIKQSKLGENVIVSPLYGVFTPQTYGLGYLLDAYFESSINTSNYLHSIVQKGAKNTINITNTVFLSKKITLPVDSREQTKIANFLSKLDQKIDLHKEQLDKMQTWKKGLLQKMFV